MKKWAVVALLWVVALLNYLDRQVIFSLLPLLRTDLSLTDAQLGLVSAAFLWVYVAFSPVAGFAADRFGHKAVILMSLFVWSIVTCATAHAASFSQLVLARAAMGIAEAFYLPAALALIAAHHSASTRSLATGLHFSGIYAGIVIGGAGGGWLGAAYGWRFPFMLLGIVGVVYSLVLIFLPTVPAEAVNRSAHPFFASSLSLLRTPGFLAIAFVFGAFSIAGWLIYAWMPVYLYEKFGMSLAEAGFNATFYIQAASFAGILAGGLLGDRWSRSGTQPMGLAIGAFFLFLAGVTTLPFFVLAGLTIYGFGHCAYDANNMPVVCQLVPESLRATAYGLLNFVGTFSGGVVAFAAGALKAQLGIGMMLAAAAALLPGAAAMLYRESVKIPMQARSLQGALR